MPWSSGWPGSAARWSWSTSSPWCSTSATDAQFGTCTGLVAVPVQAAAVLGPSVAGLVVEATGSQRTLFGVAAVAVGIAWLLLQRVHVEPGPQEAHRG